MPRESGASSNPELRRRAPIASKWLLDRPVEPSDDSKQKHLPADLSFAKFIAAPRPRT
jgi:hypothetical protein